MAPYKSAQGLARAILILLPVYIVAGIASILTQVPETFQTAQGWRVNLSSPLGPVSFLLFVALAILTPFWAVRVHKNAQALSGAPLPSSPGWTAGAWFIPIAGGVLAARPMARVLERSRGAGGPAWAWGVSWTIYQCAAAVTIGMLFTALFSMLFGLGMEPSRAEVEAAGEDLLATVRPWQWGLAAFEAGAAVCMALCIVTLQSAQRRAAASTATAPGKPFTDVGPASPWR